MTNRKHGRATRTLSAVLAVALQVIATPLVGAISVTITSAVPGARVLVFDAALTEIGDGSGSVIGLTRALVAGDILTVIQRLEQCVSASAYQVGAVCASEECLDGK